ncbi:MAG: TonB-dependent receptor [Steroidobacteraceae bacterium]|jgi:iron complex outermembrane receptor protein
MMRANPPKSLSGPCNRRLLFFSITLGAAVLSAGGASATEATSSDTTTAPANAAAAPASAGGLEEIVVTATRREENISKVPISITAMSQDMLDQKGIRDITELVRFTPGVSIDTSGTNQISIRGISSSAGAGTTGIYIDDTPIQMRELGFNPDETLPKAFDLDRVEVLRGPQGTLFGSGSEGGTVRYIFTQPSVTQDSTYLRSEASYTEYGEPSGEVGIAHGGPIIDGVLGYRASIWYRYDGGWINRVDNAGNITEPNANYSGTTAARLALLWEPSDQIKVTPSMMFQNRQQHDLGTYWPTYSDPSAGRFNNATPETIPIGDEYYLPALKVQVDLGAVTFISNSSYYYRNETDSYQGTAYDLAYYQAQPTASGSPCTSNSQPGCSWFPLISYNGINMPPGFENYATPNKMTNDQRNWVQEFRFQSNDADARVRWTAGVFWSLSQELSIENLTDPQINSLFNNILGYSAQSYFVNSTPYPPVPYTCSSAPQYNVSAAPYPAIPNCSIYYNYNKSYDRQIAGYGEATTKIVDGLSLVTGLRYSKLGFSLNHYANGYENYGPGAAAGGESNTAFTPRVGLDWQIDQDNLLYFTYAKGFRPGGYNPPLIPACGPGLIAEGFSDGKAPFTYNPDNTNSYEIGAKNNIADRLKIATSVYYIQWNNIQQNVYIAGNCGLQFTDNLGTAVAKGVDIQIDASLGEGFTLEFSAGYTDARFTKTSLGNIAVAGDAISGNASLNYAPGTSPPFTAAFGPQYAFKAFEHDAFVRLDWEYASRNPWLAPVQDPRSSQYDYGYSYTLPATSYTSARAGVKLGGGWELSLFCDNLFNKFPITNYAENQVDPALLSLRPQENDFTWRPRTIGITANMKL